MSSAAMVSLRIQVVADHQHVHMLIERVVGEGHGRVGRAGQKVGLAHHLQDVGRVAAACAFGVKGAQPPPPRGFDGVFHITRFIERVRMQGHLDVRFVGHVQAIADGRWGAAPVFVQLQANHARVDLLVQCGWQAGIAFAKKAQVHRKGISRLQHALDVERSRCAGGGKGAGGGARAAAHHGGHATGQGLVDLLGADEVDVAVDATRGHDQAFAADDLGAGANDDVHARLCIGVARFADGRDAVAAQSDVGLDDAPVVDDEGVGEHAIHRTLGVGAL
jgi:hypothetical protein